MSYEHKHLAESILQLDSAPAEAEQRAEWVKAGAHMNFLRRNAAANDVVIYASGPFSFIHAVAVSNDRLFPLDKEDLHHWNLNPYGSIASYVSGGGRKDVWVERGMQSTGTRTLKDALQLVFGRTFEGWTGKGRDYFELHQEYAHLTGIHWRPEHKAYCRFNDLGDFDPIVSITTRDDKPGNISLISFKWEALEEYLAATNASLVRMFDFTLFPKGSFGGWQNQNAEEQFEEAPSLFYRQRVDSGEAAYTRGFQIIAPRRDAAEVRQSIVDRWAGRKPTQFADFIAYDWRNQRISSISTDPKASTNYFQAEGNSLPFELSPAFFRPEVLLKYKGDKDKYTVSERDVSCRSAWHLQSFDVNEAGQVHAYICYLRRLPYEEQLHWKSFNEEPKVSISKRAYVNDFQGQFVHFQEPLQGVLSIVRRWEREDASWWKLREAQLMDRVSTPLTASRDEWAEAFLDVSKLVIEGFETAPIRKALDALAVPYDREKDKTIALLEKLLAAKMQAGSERRLIGLRKVQELRSKTKGHANGSEAAGLARDAIEEHGSLSAHFKSVCTTVIEELEEIEEAFTA